MRNGGSGLRENRIHDRASTTIRARLISETLNTVCSILDLSPTGARLQLEPGLFLPKRFILRAPDLGGDRPVEVVWRNKTQAGVRF